MKLEQPIWVMCDANGECKGLFATEELANKAADYYGAFVNNYDEVLEEMPSECRSMLTPKVMTGFKINHLHNKLSGLENSPNDWIASDAETIEQSKLKSGIEEAYARQIEAWEFLPED